MLSTNLHRFIKDSGLSFKEISESWVFVCPLCRKDDKLWISKKTGQFICFVCVETNRFTGKPEYALHALTNKPLEEIRQTLYGEVPVQFRDVLEAPLVDSDQQPFRMPIQWKPEQIPIRDSNVGIEYLSGRGIPVDVAELYGIRFNTVTNRVVFPVEQDGLLYGWQERVIGPTETTDSSGKVRKIPKMLGSPGLPRSTSLMFIDRVTSNTAILVEGPVDAIKAHHTGVGAVATMGKSVNHGQLALLRSRGVERLYIGLDPDTDTETQSVALRMSDMELYRLLPSEGYGDLGDMPFEAVKQAFDAAPRYDPQLIRAKLTF